MQYIKINYYVTGENVVPLYDDIRRDCESFVFVIVAFKDLVDFNGTQQCDV